MLTIGRRVCKNARRTACVQNWWRIPADVEKDVRAGSTEKVLFRAV
ncbi:hypothetical protein [Cupriavidus sp. AcVe19-1a]|nr:hypothetical protein [Cupriavidus sp. AcVe19-1a]